MGLKLQAVLFASVVATLASVDAFVVKHKRSAGPPPMPPGTFYRWTRITIAGSIDEAAFVPTGIPFAITGSGDLTDMSSLGIAFYDFFSPSGPIIVLKRGMQGTCYLVENYDISLEAVVAFASANNGGSVSGTSAEVGLDGSGAAYSQAQRTLLFQQHPALEQVCGPTPIVQATILSGAPGGGNIVSVFSLDVEFVIAA